MKTEIATDQLAHILYFHLPEYRQLHPTTASGLDILKMAEDLGVASQLIHNWLRRNRIPATRIPALIELKNSRLTPEVLYPFSTRRSK